MNNFRRLFIFAITVIALTTMSNSIADRMEPLFDWTKVTLMLSPTNIIHENGTPRTESGVIRDQNGNKLPLPFNVGGGKIYTNDAGVIHRENGPAIIYPDGTKVYVKNGRFHRDGGSPAIVRSDGYKAWFIKGRYKVYPYDNTLEPTQILADGTHIHIEGLYFHNHYGPAIKYLDGGFEVYINGFRHSERSPAVKLGDGTTGWFLHGKAHRLGGPAGYDGFGNEEWWVHGKLHRLDVPAVERADGSKEWWVRGVQMTQEEIAARK